MSSRPEIWLVDCEWGFREGRIDFETAYEPVCFCAVGVRSGERVHFWGRDDGLRRFIADQSDCLFVAHAAVAEMKFLLRQGVPLPERWFDTHAAWRRQHNGPDRPPSDLNSALRAIGAPYTADKYEMQQTILHLRFSPADHANIIAYCFSDCDGAGHLYRHLVGQIKPATMDYWVEFLKPISHMELRGIPFDRSTARLVYGHGDDITSGLVAQLNKTARVFGKGGAFSRKRFLTWAYSQGIEWPSTMSRITGRWGHSISDDTLKSMSGRHPFIAELRDARKTISGFRRIAITADGRTDRHHFSTRPWASITGRNQPRNFVFCGPKWLRMLIRPDGPDRELAFLDFVAQEVGVAAALSGDANMSAMYLSGTDPHVAFAIQAGAAPAGATKDSHPDVRDQYKTVNIAVLYGQGDYGVSHRLGIREWEAAGLLRQHHELYPRYWAWSRGMVEAAYRRGAINSLLGWAAQVPRHSNYRTWMNWPIQATGGDIMRLTIIYLSMQGVRLLAPVHDGFLLSYRKGEEGALGRAVELACNTASEQVLGGFRLHYKLDLGWKDRGGEKMYAKIREILGGLYDAPK